MRKTVGEILDMGHDGFLDAMLEELEAKALRPGLSDEERRLRQDEVSRTRAEIVARRARGAAEREKAAAKRAA